MFPCAAVDASTQKIYHDEAELLSDTAITKPLGREVEAIVEPPVRKISVQETESSLDSESLIEAPPRKISRDRNEGSINIALRKGLSNELDTEFSTRKVERDTFGELLDSASRNVYRERSDFPLEVRKMIWNEIEATADLPPRKISGDMMGASIDSTSRKMLRDDVEHPFDSAPRRLTRDSMGKSLDSSSRKLPWSKGECQLDSSVRSLTKEKMVETSKTPQRKKSRDELEYCPDAASMKMLPREKIEALMDTTHLMEMKDSSVEPSPSRRTLRDELEMSAGSLRRRILRMPRDDTDTLTDSPVNFPKEIPKHSGMEEFGGSESSSFPGRSGQPDLMVTSQVPWKSSSDLYPGGPLSQLVYDGILEKSCKSMTTVPTSLSASTPNLPQSRVQAEAEVPLAPPSAAFPPKPSPRQKSRDKEKSRKSLKLKNLFKKKNEPSSENLQSEL